MNHRTARGNRVGLAVTGLVLAVAGAAALARGLDLLPAVLGPDDAAVTDQSSRDFARDQPWFWPALAAALLLVALLALRWIVVQARTDAVRTVRLEPDVRHGVTTVPAGAVTGALEDDLAASPCLHRASARLTGTPRRPRANVVATLRATADPAAARDDIGRALDRHRQAVDADRVPATVKLRTSH